MLVSLHGFSFMLIWASEFCLNSTSTAMFSLTTLIRSTHFVLEIPKVVTTDQLLTWIIRNNSRGKGLHFTFWYTNFTSDKDSWAEID